MGVMKDRLIEQQAQDEVWENRPDYPSSAEVSEDEGTRPSKKNKTEVTTNLRPLQTNHYTTHIKQNLSRGGSCLQSPISTFSPTPSTSIDLYVLSDNTSDNPLVLEWSWKGQQEIPFFKPLSLLASLLHVDSHGIESEICSNLLRPSSDKITFKVSKHDITKAEQQSNGSFNFSNHTNYIVRLAFFSTACTPSTSNPDALQSKESVRKEIAFNSSPHPFDVRLVFITNNSEDKQSLWTSSELLKRSSTYFENLFNPEFGSIVKKNDIQRKIDEINNDRDSELSSTLENLHRDNDSDAGVDEIAFEAPSSSNNEPHPTFPYYRIQITDNACTTYKAVLTYLQFNHIRFAPLTSSFEPLPEDMRHLARLDYLSKHKLDDSLLPYPASPKSVYRLAQSLDLPSLSALALSNYSSQLSPSIVASEIKDPIIEEHEEICQVLVNYLAKDWNEIVGIESFEELLEKVKTGQVTLSGSLLAKLLPLLKGNENARTLGKRKVNFAD